MPDRPSHRTIVGRDRLRTHAIRQTRILSAPRPIAPMTARSRVVPTSWLPGAGARSGGCVGRRFGARPRLGVAGGPGRLAAPGPASCAGAQQPDGIVLRPRGARSVSPLRKQVEQADKHESILPRNPGSASPEARPVKPFWSATRRRRAVPCDHGQALPAPSAMTRAAAWTVTYLFEPCSVHTDRRWAWRYLYRAVDQYGRVINVPPPGNRRGPTVLVASRVVIRSAARMRVLQRALRWLLQSTRGCRTDISSLPSKDRA